RSARAAPRRRRSPRPRRPRPPAPARWPGRCPVPPPSPAPSRRAVSWCVLVGASIGESLATASGFAPCCPARAGPYRASASPSTARLARGDFPSTSRRQPMTSHRFARRTLIACVLAAGALGALGTAQAQTKLKWAHVYETSEPYHKWSVWAGDEIKKRTSGRYEVQVFPASSLGTENDINQGLL